MTSNGGQGFSGQAMVDPSGRRRFHSPTFPSAVSATVIAYGLIAESSVGSTGPMAEEPAYTTPTMRVHHGGCPIAFRFPTTFLIFGTLVRLSQPLLNCETVESGCFCAHPTNASTSRSHRRGARHGLHLVPVVSPPGHRIDTSAIMLSPSPKTRRRSLPDR